MQTPSKEDQWFIRHGITPPEHISHDLNVDDISKVVKPGNPRNWRAEGDRLIADTDFGPLVQRIPTSHLFVGVDKKGLPMFKKV